MTRETVATVVLARFATSVMVGRIRITSRVVNGLTVQTRNQRKMNAKKLKTNGEPKALQEAYLCHAGTSSPHVSSVCMAFLKGDSSIITYVRRMLPPRWSLVPEKIVALFVGIIALWPVVQFLQVALARMNYPFELEWMEGGIVDHIRIVLSGHSLYRKPSLEFTPFIYVPGYYYLSAIVSKIVGVGFLAPRLVSTLSILGCFLLLAKWVHHESGSILAALVTAGLFAATYGQSEFWFDLARVDSLFLFLSLAGYYCARASQALKHSILCGLLLALAAITKQVGLVLALPPLGYVFWQSRKQGIVAFSVFALALFITFGILEITSGGWFSVYAFRLPADHSVNWSEWRTILRTQFWGPITPMIIGTLALIIGNAVRLSWSRWAYLVTGVLAAVGTSYMSILHTGGYPNVLMPAHAMIAMGSGLVFSRLWQPQNHHEHSYGAPWGNRTFALTLLLIQMALLPAIRLQALVPSSQDRAAGVHVLARIKASPGPVWMISSGYYPLLTHGSSVQSHAMGFTDVFKSRQEPIKLQTMNLLLTQIQNKRFGTIVRDRATGFLPDEISQAINQHYHLKEQLLQPYDERFWPKSGASIRPDELWAPNPPL